MERFLYFTIFLGGGLVLLTFFQICFFVGLVLIVISFIFGNLFELAGLEGLDLDFDILGINMFLPINLTLYILFATVFGGVGWIMLNSYPFLAKVIIITISVVSGLFICTLVNNLVMKPLKKAQNTSAPEQEELIGVRAVVTETIFAEGFGEIRYEVKGNSFTSPAKSTTGVEIKAGKEVAICWIENHVYYVVDINEMICNS